MATFAIGDVHAQLTPLTEVLVQIAADATRDDTVVFLGDYLDRGRDARACVDAILDFTTRTPARVVCLMGNHEQWMLRALRDPTDHSWLRGMDGLRTIASYSRPAASRIAAAMRRQRAALHGGLVALPYELFAAAMPPEHRHFFESLSLFTLTADCLCAHGGLDPRIEALADQGRAFVWGGPGFPEHYRGATTVVYGHHDNAVLDGDGWPHARIMHRTYGVDTISHGVLTALRLPGPVYYQSGRHTRRHVRDRQEPL